MYLIAAVDQNWAIGYQNKLLARISPDLKRFKALTLGHPVLLGRKTLETFPGSKPLPGRQNYILSTNPDYKVENAVVLHSLEEARAVCPADTFVIGGAQVYRAALDGWNAAADAAGPADQFAINTALGGADTAMYQQTDAAGGVTEAISGQYTEFLSRQDIILRTAANDYNPAAQGYNDTVSGFPANVIGLLWGAGEVQLFQ